MAYAERRRPPLTRIDTDHVALVAVITGDKPGERCITLGTGNGTFQRWKLTEELARKIRRELNERLD